MANLFDDDADLDVFDAVEQEVDADTPAPSIERTPRTNPDLFGHEVIEKQLLADYQAGRLPHAIILSGMAGIGKMTLALRLARFLFTQNDGGGAGLFGDATPVTSLYVGADNPIFRRVASSGHADLLTIEREFDDKRGKYKNDIAVDAIRRIHPFMQKTAAEGGWRIVIIDGAEYMNTASQNALLKVLEEPPKKALLILTTSQPGAFLPTIRSRCRLMTLDPLSSEVMTKLLDISLPTLGDGDKESLIRLSEGSIGKALQFYKDDGLTLYRQLLSVVTNLPTLDMVALYDMAEKLGKFGAEKNFATAFEILSLWCQRHIRSHARGKNVADILVGDAGIFSKLQNNYSLSHILQAQERIEKLQQQVESYNLDKKQAVIAAFLTLQRPDYQGLSI